MIQQSLCWAYIFRENLVQKATCSPMLIATLFTIAKTWKQPKYPSREEYIEMWYIYKMEYYSAICRNMDEPKDHHAKQSKSDRERQIYDIPYMWNLRSMIQMNLFTKQNQTHMRNKLMATKGESREAGEW